jgi:hypothetical protein
MQAAQSSGFVPLSSVMMFAGVVGPIPERVKTPVRLAPVMLPGDKPEPVPQVKSLRLAILAQLANASMPVSEVAAALGRDAPEVMSCAMFLHKQGHLKKSPKRIPAARTRVSFYYSIAPSGAELLKAA